MTLHTIARALCFSGLLAMSSGVQAAIINYGDFTGSSVKFIGVQESSGTDPVPLFGTPDVAGDTIDFDPVSFNSFSSGAGGVDITDGTLSFKLAALTGSVLDVLRLQEQGDVTLAGFGGAGTTASIRTNVFINILAVDGVSITPVNVTGGLIFAPSGGTYDLASDGGGGPFYNTAWNGVFDFDLTQALVDHNVPFVNGTTLISVTFDNTLVTTSQAGTSAFIAKKDVQGITFTVVPEASSIVMMSLAACGILFIRTSRRSA